MASVQCSPEFVALVGFPGWHVEGLDSLETGVGLGSYLKGLGGQVFVFCKGVLGTFVTVPSEQQHACW